MTTTRRQLGVLAVGVALAADARAGTGQASPAPPAPAGMRAGMSPSAEEAMARAIAFRDKHAAVVRAAAARLPADIEPAFAFSARDTQ